MTESAATEGSENDVYVYWVLMENDQHMYRVAQNNVYTLWHEKCYSIIVTTVFIQKQNWYERCPWILDSM